MTRNMRLIWVASVIFGLSIGCYDFILPYYLKSRDLSYPRMGAVFALSSIAMFFVRVYAGRLSDLFGRKRFYSLALLGSGFANLLTPTAGSVGTLSLLRSLREASVVTRESMQALLLYAEDRKRYAQSVGRTLGSEYVFQGLGTLAAGALMIALGMGRSLTLCAGLLFAAALLFSLGYREYKDPEAKAPEPISPLRLFSFDMPRELRIIATAAFIGSVGVSMTHCFTMPLFFSMKFGATEATVAIILGIHRVLLGAPMLFAARVVHLHPRNTYVTFTALQGLIMIAGAVIPSFWPATIVWLLHDFLGAGIWVPIQSALIQRYSHDADRGLLVSKTMAFSLLGWVVGPLAAGYLAKVSINTPFLVGGLFALLAAVPLVWLPDHSAEYVHYYEPTR